MGKPSPPTPPDPTVVANAQAAANTASATAQQKLNLINTTGPDGTVNYAPSSAPGGYTQTTTLSPGQQGLYDSSLSLQQGALNTGQKALAAADSALGTPLTPPTLGTAAGYNQAASDAVYQQGASRLDPQYAQADSAMRSRLAAQGLVPGTAAYDNAYANFSRSKNDAYTSLSNQATLTGADLGLQQGAFDNAALQQNFSNQGTAQNMPINQLTGLLGLGQVQSPTGVSYSPTSVAPTDVTGAYALNSQAQNAAYQAKSQMYGSTLGGLFNLGAAALMPATGGASMAGMGMRF